MYLLLYLTNSYVLSMLILNSKTKYTSRLLKFSFSYILLTVITQPNIKGKQCYFCYDKDNSTEESNCSCYFAAMLFYPDLHKSPIFRRAKNMDAAPPRPVLQFIKL